MTKAEWLANPDFSTQTKFVVEHLSPRRLRLLAAGFCRAVPQLADFQHFLSILDTIERFADGLARAHELETVRQKSRATALESYERYAEKSTNHHDPGQQEWLESQYAWAVAFAATTPVPTAEVGERVMMVATGSRVVGLLRESSPEVSNATEAETHLSRFRGVVWDIAGDPFAQPLVERDWRTETAIAMARQMYEANDFSAMPILADALQDAGCDDDAILNHCRDTGIAHYRGCWVIDQLLSKK